MLKQKPGQIESLNQRKYAFTQDSPQSLLIDGLKNINVTYFYYYNTFRLHHVDYYGFCF